MTSIVVFSDELEIDGSVETRSADDRIDVGMETGPRVTDDEPRGDFTGTIHWIQLDLGIEDTERYVTPEDRYRAAMMRQ